MTRTRQSSEASAPLLRCPVTGAELPADSPLAAAFGAELSTATHTAEQTSTTAATPLSAENGGSVDDHDAEKRSGAGDDISDDATIRSGDLAVYYDPLSFSAYENPYELYKVLREKAPVYYNERRRLWVVSRYNDVREILKNHQQFSSALGNDMDGTHDSYGAGNIVASDQPEHTSLRTAVRRVFAAREILEKEDGLRAFARELLAKLYASGEGDFAEDVALPLAIAGAIMLVGLPKEDGPWIHDHLLQSMERVVGQYGIPEAAAASNIEAEEHIARWMEERYERFRSGEEDASSSEAIAQIYQAVGKGKVESQYQAGLAHLLESAAVDAPSALATNIITHLDKFPAFHAYLESNPDRISDFLEELLRYDAPAQNLCRQTIEEVSIANVRIPKDSRVMVLLASANRDEDIFDHADFFDIDREITPKNKIMTFGEGIHACMGSPLARLVGRVLLEELVQGPPIRVVGVPERWAKQMVRGFSKLPVKVMPVNQP
jgi:cytochrome P450